jgi:glycosyltransferase involved in cell wall biosynthesis
MRLLFVCDGRSPIAMNWITYFVDRGDEVHIVSTFEFTPQPGFASVNIIPVAFSQLKVSQGQKGTGDQKKGLLWNSSLVNFRTAVRRIGAPVTIQPAARKLSNLISDLQPELIHAMRIPFEGILTARAVNSKKHAPLIVSVWGNDFTLHAEATQWMGKSTRQVLSRADGLHTDCQRDRNLASKWGYSIDRPALVIPGNGGIDIDLFNPPEDAGKSRKFTVINPRGIRAYIRNDTFFAAIPLILAQLPDTRFVCPGMAGEAEAVNWIEEYKIASAVDLLPKVPRNEMPDLFRDAAVAISPSTHDGTPNTLLEAMACGCFPVAGDLDSIREWIEPGINGCLFDPDDPSELAQAVIDALSQEELRRQAAQLNVAMIAERAEYHSSMTQAINFYQSFL